MFLYAICPNGRASSSSFSPVTNISLKPVVPSGPTWKGELIIYSSSSHNFSAIERQHSTGIHRFSDGVFNSMSHKLRDFENNRAILLFTILRLLHDTAFHNLSFYNHRFVSLFCSYGIFHRTFVLKSVFSFDIFASLFYCILFKGSVGTKIFLKRRETVPRVKLKSGLNLVMSIVYCGMILLTC